MRLELYGVLLSLSIHHPKSNVLVGCDENTYLYLNNEVYPKCIDLNLNIKWYPELYNDFTDEDNLNLQGKPERYREFLSIRPKLMIDAINTFGDTLLLGSDMIITHPISDINASCVLGLSSNYFYYDLIGGASQFGKFFVVL